MNLTPHEVWVAAQATHYSTCVFRGRGWSAISNSPYEKIECVSLEEARAAGYKLLTSTDHGVMIYAIYRMHQALIEIIE